MRPVIAMPVRRGRYWLGLAGAGVLALIVRLVYLAELQGSPLLSGLMGDSRQYDAWAQRIAGGDWLGAQVFYQSPLYAYGLAAVFRIAGHDLSLIRTIQALLGSASCVLLGLAGRRFFSGRTGVAAAALLAVYPAAFFFDGLIQKSSLDIFLVALMLALLGRFAARGDWPDLAALGVTIGALALNRENARILVPVIAAWLWFGFSGTAARRRLAWLAAFAVAVMAVWLPVAYRNHRVGGEFLLSTSQSGPNFYIGNHPGASGTYEPLVPERGDPMFERDDAARLASQAEGRALSPSEASAYWFRRSLAYIRSQPLDWLGLLGRKLLLAVNAAELPDTESIEAYAGYSRLLRGMLWLNFGVVLPVAVAGAWAVRARGRQLAALFAIFGALLLSLVAFYVVARYRHPLVPVVILFAAAGLTGCIDRLARRAPSAPVREEAAGRRRPGSRQPVAAERPLRGAMPGLAGAAAVALIAHLPIITVRDQTSLNLGSLLAQSGRTAEAIDVLAKAAALDPDHAEARFRLGLACRDAGRPQAAIEELSAAVRLRPDHAEARLALGNLLRGEGRAEEALQQYREAARLVPESDEAYTNLGLALMEAGRHAEAVASLRRSVELAPERAGTHNNLAMALQQAGEIRQAVAVYDKALALDPASLEAHVNLATALASLGEFDAASAHFDEAVRLQPANPQVRLTYGSALCGAGQVTACIGQYEAATRQSPDLLEAWTLLAQAYARAGRIADAEASLEKGLSIAEGAGRSDAARGIREAILQLQRIGGRRSP